MSMTKTKKRFIPPPFVIDGSRVMFYSLIRPPIVFSGHTNIIIGGREVGRVPRLIIGEALRGKDFVILHCDKNWNAIAHGGGYDSAKDAKLHAERIYHGIAKTWVKYSVSKREALAIERQMWGRHVCSFCNRVPPEFNQCFLGKKATICNICVEEFYSDSIEAELLAINPLRGDYYPEKGFERINSYVSRLVMPTDNGKFMMIFAADGRRGFALIAHRSKIAASFVLPGRRQIAREENIRSFFSSKGQPPSRDYLADKGLTRILEYPVHGSVEELVDTVKTVLDLCGVSSKEALVIRYEER
jgi:hypothetical protein